MRNVPNNILFILGSLGFIWLVIEFLLNYLFDIYILKGQGAVGLIALVVVIILTYAIRHYLHVVKQLGDLRGKESMGASDAMKFSNTYVVYYMHVPNKISKSFLEIKVQENSCAIRYKHTSFASNEGTIQYRGDNLFISLKGSNHQSTTYLILKNPLLDNFNCLKGIIAGITDSKIPAALRVVLVRSNQPYDLLHPEKLDISRIEKKIADFLNTKENRSVQFNQSEITADV